MSDEVRCTGCGKTYSRQFIRCWSCRTLTAESEAYHREAAERMAARRRGVVIVPAVTIILWGLIALVVMLLT